MRKFTHLIVSRVNVKWLPQSKDSVWLNDRIVLLNNILRSSIEAQTDKNFKFVTLWGYEPVGRIDNEYQLMFDVEFMNRIHDEMIPKLLELVDEDYVLTTRIDTDNAMGFNFIENLHRHVLETESVAETEIPFYYDITKMGVYNLMTKSKRVWNTDHTSAFISIMEDRRKYKCIPFGYDHSKIENDVNGLKFDDLNVICTIHGKNVAMKNEFGTPSNFNVGDYGLNI
jgi:hypothetical protein